MLYTSYKNGDDGGKVSEIVLPRWYGILISDTAHIMGISPIPSVVIPKIMFGFIQMLTTSNYAYLKHIFVGRKGPVGLPVSQWLESRVN